MEPLDLTLGPPRPCRTTLLGYFMLARTIDKLRAELPGGNIGTYLNHDTGFSAYVVKRLGLDMTEFREAVAAAADESAVVAWLEARIDPAGAPALNAKLESFTISRMSPDDQALVRARHPAAIAQQPDLDNILDVLDNDDRLAFVK
jgi:hypothetical protein